jgi:proline iminopeptidase
MRHALALALVLLAAACSGEEAPPPASQGPAAVGTVAVDGADLPYRIVGNGRPCIVFGDTILYPRSLSRRLAGELRCVHFGARVFLPDAQRRGGVPYGITEAVEDIEVVREQLGVEPFVLMGHSIGGLVVMAYAARYPEHVTHVVAISAPPSVPFARDSAQAYRGRGMSAGRMAQYEANVSRADSLEAAHLGRGFIPGYIANAALYWADSTYDATALFEGVGVNDTLFNDLQRTPFDWEDVTTALEVPVFVALGKYDFVVSPPVWAGVDTPFQDLTVHVFENAGHWPQLEDPSAFDTAVLEWIGSREP